MPSIFDRLLKILQEHPDGITIDAIRRELGLRADEHQHLDRRIRDLRDQYEIPYVRGSGYRLLGSRTDPPVAETVSLTVRAAVIDRAMGQCQMCGRTIQAHGIVLQVDHRIPRNWGGSSSMANLWAICSECNRGKRDHFSSFDADVMKKVMTLDSVHARIGEILKLGGDTGVDASLVEFVARQREWDRRLRELRDLGWEYEAVVAAEPDGRRVTTYFLRKSAPIPSNAREVIRGAEAARRRKRLSRD